MKNKFQYEEDINDLLDEALSTLSPEEFKSLINDIYTILEDYGD